MYFWNVNAVVNDLKAGRVTEAEKAKYLFAFEAISFFSLSYSMIMLFLVIFFLFNIVVLAWGIRYCYLKNDQGDGKDFLSRFVCIGWPATVRFICFSIIVLGTLALLLVYSGMFETESAALLFSTVALVIKIFYYRYVGSKIAAVAGRLKGVLK